MVKYYILYLKERELLTVGTHLPRTVIRAEDMQCWIDQLSAQGEIVNRTDDHIVFRVEFVQKGYKLEYIKRIR